MTDPVMTSDERLARMMEKILIQAGTRIGWTLDDGYVLSTSGAYVRLDEDDMILVKELHAALKEAMGR